MFKQTAGSSNHGVLFRSGQASTQGAGVLTQQITGAAAAWVGPVPGEPGPSLQPGSNLSLLKCGEANIIAPEMGQRNIETNKQKKTGWTSQNWKGKTSISSLPHNDKLRCAKSVPGKLAFVNRSYTEMVSDTHCHFINITKIHTDNFVNWKMDTLHTLIHTTEDKQNTMEWRQHPSFLVNKRAMQISKWGRWKQKSSSKLSDGSSLKDTTLQEKSALEIYIP